MKVLITITMDVPNVTDEDTAYDLIQNWVSESDYVMSQRHFNERSLPTNPSIQEVKNINEE